MAEVTQDTLDPSMGDGDPVFSNHSNFALKIKNKLHKFTPTCDLLITSDLIHLETERRNECPAPYQFLSGI